MPIMGRTVSITIIFFLIGLSGLSAQKVIRKTLEDPEATYLEIDTANCFKLELSTSESREIVVEAQIDGEYRNDLLVRVEQHGPIVRISAGFQPSFVVPNDKLSAHKVISISIQVRIPEKMNVSVLGSSSNVLAKGDYNNLKVVLDDGNCSLREIHGVTHALTRSGDIDVNTKGALFNIKNKYGTIQSDNVPQGDDYFDLTTTTGDIHLIKIE